MVEKAAGGADQHIRAAFELAVLVLEGNAADQKGDVKAVVLAVFLEILGDLGGEFARRFENQRAGHDDVAEDFPGNRPQSAVDALARIILEDARKLVMDPADDIQEVFEKPLIGKIFGMINDRNDRPDNQ